MVYIDLFAGAGGLSLGLHNAGLKGLFAIEKNATAFNTLKVNLMDDKDHFSWVEWLDKAPQDIDILLREKKEELKSLRGSVDLVVGSPPCQSFSTAGLRRVDDERSDLVYSYIKFIELVMPQYILLENVKGITFRFKGQKCSYAEELENRLKGLGYSVASKIIDISNYGVPQARKRYILIGALNGRPEEVFQFLDSNKDRFLSKYYLRDRVNIGEAISDLTSDNIRVACIDSPSYQSCLYGEISSPYQALMRKGITSDIPDSHRFAKHSEKIIEIHQRIIDKNIRSKQIKSKDNIIEGLHRRNVTLLDEYSVAPTLTNSPDELVHYKEPRILTVREYARLQSFPDWYRFTGKYTTGGRLRKVDVPRYTQVGNAVPPLFAEQLGLAFLEVVKRG